MRISFSTAALYPRPTLEALTMIGKSGFREAELMPQCLEETKPAFARKALETGIKVSSIHFPLVFFSLLYNPYPGMIREARNMADELAASAEILRSEIVVVHALPKMDSQKANLFEQPVLDNLRYLADRLEMSGVRLAVENNPNTLADTAGGLIGFVKTLAHRNVGPMVDTTEAWEAGIDPAGFIDSVKPIHLHLSDHSGEQKHVPMGKGEGDWKGIIKTLRQLDYSGIYVLEPAYKNYLETSCNDLQKDREFLSSL